MIIPATPCTPKKQIQTKANFHPYATPPNIPPNKQTTPLSLNKSLYLFQKTPHRPPIQPKMPSFRNLHNFGPFPPMILHMIEKPPIPPRRKRKNIPRAINGENTLDTFPLAVHLCGLFTENSTGRGCREKGRKVGNGSQEWRNEDVSGFRTLRERRNKRCNE